MPNNDVIIDASKRKDGVGFQTGKSIESYGNASAGRTLYCGTRRSPKYARFYNKGDSDRFEIEYKQALARAIFADYLSCCSPDSTFILTSILRSSISFAVRRDKNLTRANVHSWWADFQSRIIGGEHKFVRPKPRPSLDRTLKWIHRAVSKSLLIAREALGTDALNQLLELWEYEARARCDDSDIDKIRQFTLNPLSLNELMAVI
jgi:Replication initiation factor